MVSNKYVIDVDELNKTYGSGELAVHALQDVSFKVKSGEFVAIMGPSGSGKSTLMNILGCLDTPTSGFYQLAGNDISSLKERELAKIRNIQIGFVFQTFNLLPRFSALKNVEQPMIYRGLKKNKRKEKALAALAAVGLADRVEHKPNELSGGQKQRVAIARSLVNDPSIILADEPTGNLDSESESEILNILNGLHEDGITIVMVTHEREVAEHADRIVHFRDGKIVDQEIIKDYRGEPS